MYVDTRSLTSLSMVPNPIYCIMARVRDKYVLVLLVLIVFVMYVSMKDTGNIATEVWGRENEKMRWIDRMQ